MDTYPHKLGVVYMRFGGWMDECTHVGVDRYRVAIESMYIFS